MPRNSMTIVIMFFIKISGVLFYSSALFLMFPAVAHWTGNEDPIYFYSFWAGLTGIFISHIASISADTWASRPNNL